MVGNPPYADESKKGSYNSLWDKFVLRAYDLVKDSGQVVMITPQTWFTQPRLNKGNGVAKVKALIETNAVFVQTEGVAEHFSVGSTFSYYSIAKHPTVQVKVNGVTVQTPKLLTELKDEKELLIDKLLGAELFPRAEKASAKGGVSKEQTPKNQAATVMTHKRDGYLIQYAEHASRLHNTPKAIFMVRTIHNRPIIDQKGEVSPPTGSTSSVYVFDTVQELDNFGKLFDTKLYRFLVKGQRRHHGFLSSKTTSSVPKVDLTKTWSDVELYAHFNLTPEEIDLIESSV